MLEMVKRAQSAMATARGICDCDNMLVCKPDGSPRWTDDEIEQIVVAAAITDAVNAERKACAELAWIGCFVEGPYELERQTADQIAKAIELRGQVEPADQEGKKR